MRMVQWWAALALTVVFAMVSGKAIAQILSPGESDSVDFFVGKPSRQTTIRHLPILEGPGGDSILDYTLPDPIIIEFIARENDSVQITDRVTINSLAFTFTSDMDEKGIKPTPGAENVLETGKHPGNLLRVAMASDLDPPIPGPISDTAAVYSHTHLLAFKRLLEGPTGSESYTYNLPAPLTFDFYEPNTGRLIFSDELVIKQFSVTFDSDDEPGGLQHIPGAFLLRGENHRNAFVLQAHSDFSDVPEPSARSLLPAGLLSLAWILWRQRLRNRRMGPFAP
jgi:hypothetical protein